MEEKTLLLIAIIVIIIGLPLIAIGKNFVKEDERIMTVLEGTVTSAYTTKGVTIVSVMPKKPIPAVFFEKVNYTKGQDVKIEGKLHEYKNKIEFLGE